MVVGVESGTVVIAARLVSLPAVTWIVLVEVPKSVLELVLGSCVVKMVDVETVVLECW